MPATIGAGIVVLPDERLKLRIYSSDATAIVKGAISRTSGVSCGDVGLQG
jgi:hypothetical protein